MVHQLRAYGIVGHVTHLRTEVFGFANDVVVEILLPMATRPLAAEPEAGFLLEVGLPSLNLSGSRMTYSFCSKGHLVLGGITEAETHRVQPLQVFPAKRIQAIRERVYACVSSELHEASRFILATRK